MEKKKCYVLIISKSFPKTHPKSGEGTGFESKITAKEKIHTLRANYGLWKKRIDEIQNGNAYLSVREWVGMPYRSKQIELFRFEDIGIEKLEWTALGWFVDDVDNDVLTKELANKDGLSFDDFKDWFKKYPKEPMAIIHFTDFRYSEQNI